MRPALFLTLFVAVLSACSGAPRAEAETASPEKEAETVVPDDAASLVVSGGCFWCVESDFEHLPAVYEVISGFSGGEKRDATYRNHEGHREAAEIFYDPSQTSYEELVHVFLRKIDPTDRGGQFCDRGYAYTTAIYYRTDAEREAAEKAVADAEAELGKPVATAVEAFKFFVAADAYHQNYYRSDDKIPTRYGYLTKRDAYKQYRKGCGRDARVQSVWGASSAGPATK
ncbi:MAG: peptide-methionine (S)-S-oxide reductase MsrA [Parvularcula sp.]